MIYEHLLSFISDCNRPYSASNLRTEPVDIQLYFPRTHYIRTMSLRR